MTAARERSARMLDDYMNALEAAFEEHAADARRRADMQVEAETEKLEREINKRLSIGQLDLKREASHKQGELKDKLSACRFAGGMSLALKSGLTPEQGMEFSENLIEDDDFRKKVAECKADMENGTDIRSPYFQQMTWKSYEDELIVTDAEPLISYIHSCHGNQNQYLPDRYKDFRALVKKKTENGFHITKDAGVFLCEKVTNLK